MKHINLLFNKPIPDLTILEDTEITGLFIGKENDFFQSDFKIIHDRPACRSCINLKAVLYANSILDLKPKLIIARGSKLTDSYLKIQVLLIGPDSRATVVPSLEICENEVTAGHAAVIGKLDQDQLIYLESRGLSLKNAQNLLITAFIKNILS